MMEKWLVNPVKFTKLFESCASCLCFDRWFGQNLVMKKVAIVWMESGAAQLSVWSNHWWNNLAGAGYITIARALHFLSQRDLERSGYGDHIAVHLHLSKFDKLDSALEVTPSCFSHCLRWFWLSNKLVYFERFMYTKTQPSIPISIGILQLFHFWWLRVDGVLKEVRQICIWLMISVPLWSCFLFSKRSMVSWMFVQVDWGGWCHLSKNPTMFIKSSFHYPSLMT